MSAQNASGMHHRSPPGGDETGDCGGCAVHTKPCIAGCNYPGSRRFADTYCCTLLHGHKEGPRVAVGRPARRRPRRQHPGGRAFHFIGSCLCVFMIVADGAGILFCMLHSLSPFGVVIITRAIEYIGRCRVRFGGDLVKQADVLAIDADSLVLQRHLRRLRHHGGHGVGSGCR
jgi:hypothetical protein